MITDRLSRLDIRTTSAAKATLEQAAHYLGTTTSAFILQSAMEKALSILQQEQTLELNQQEMQHFFALLDKPSSPNKKLIKLFKQHADK